MYDYEKIARLNDEFRQSLQCIVIPPVLMIHKACDIPGEVVVTSGIDALMLEDKVNILERVRTFNDFTEDNHPHGEHDFGNFEYNKEKIFWKFDYYDNNLQYHSEDPADPAKTRRVMTVMLALEY